MSNKFNHLILLGIFLALLSGIPPAVAGRTIHFIVAKDGTGNYKTIQEAINAVPDWRQTRTFIFIKKGRYKEKITIPETKKLLTLIGENELNTIITYDDFATRKSILGEDIGTGGSPTCFVYSNDFTAEHLTFENTAGPVGQAVAVLVSSDRVKFDHCRFLGFQDTICTWGDHSQQYYSHCYIEGTIDFIFGPAAVLFDTCVIYCKNAGFITAASTPKGNEFGYVFRSCTITGSALKDSFYLGRPWRPFAKTVFLSCNLGHQITAAGWDNWGNKSNEQTAYYAEYNNTGAGASKAQRVPWAHELSTLESEVYTLRRIFPGWDPVAQQ